MRKRRRVRVTLSLPEHTVAWLDSLRKKGGSRSGVVETVLREVLRHREQLELEEEVRAYYAVPPTAEEKAFTKALGRAARKLVIDEPPLRRRG